MDNKEELENISEVVKDSPIENPEMTFCEKTTYLEFLLSNAKNDEEAEQIKSTINNYLDLYNAHDDSRVDEDIEDDEEITEE